MIDVENAKKVFFEYVNKYNINDGRIALKVNHILRVAEISKNIAISLNLSQEDIEIAEIIGLLHDIGRFEQVAKYNTFVDRDSINHGEYGAKILFEDGLVEKFNIDKKYYDVIRLGILNHNRKAIQDGLGESELLHCKIIRDSDKIDIYHVLLTDNCQNTYGCKTLENEVFTDEIIREFKEEHYIDYNQVKTYADRWTTHIAYVYDFNFKSSYAILKEKDYINKMLEMANFKIEDTKVKAQELIDMANEQINKGIIDETLLEEC